MKGFVLTLACACLALSACSDRNTVPTEPEAAVPLFTTNSTYGDALDGTSAVFPSTNEQNPTEAYAYVMVTGVAVGEVTLTFVSTNNWYSCFEYRIDDEAPTSTENGGDNYNADVIDGLWLYTCQKNSSTEMTFSADQYVDIRLAFGAETDERFDWTRFYVLSLPNKDECQAGEWEALGFKNQGQCVRYVETGRDSRVDG